MPRTRNTSPSARENPSFPACAVPSPHGSPSLPRRTLHAARSPHCGGGEAPAEHGRHAPRPRASPCRSRDAPCAQKKPPSPQLMHGKDRFSATYAVRLRPIHRTQKTCLFGRKPSLFQAGGLSPLHEEALSVLLRGRSRPPPYHAAPPKLPSPSPGAPCMPPLSPLRGWGSTG